MLPRPDHMPDGTGRLTTAALAATQTMELLHGGSSGLGVLAYHKPVPRNPYQSLLYARCWEHGIAPVPVPSPQSLAELGDVARLVAHVALHLHWTQPITAGAADAAEADRLAGAFLDLVDRLRDDGGTFVWTVHNTWPHDLAHHDVELGLRRGLTARADLVHVLSEATFAAADEAGYPLPTNRSVLVPHPNYIGSYPQRSDRVGVRSELGLHPRGPVLGAVGAIRPYKRTGVLLDAFDGLLARTDRSPAPRLLVAGAGAPPGLRDRVDRHPAAVGVHEDLDDARLVDLVRACDVIVLPYQQALNSGALVLALSCGRPVVAPDLGGLAGIADPPVVTSFDPDEPEDLVRALQAAVDIAGDRDVQQRARRVAEELDPDALADAFATAVRRTWSDQAAPSER